VALLKLADKGSPPTGAASKHFGGKGGIRVFFLAVNPIVSKRGLGGMPGGIV